MKETTGNLNNRKHFCIHQLRNGELKETLGGINDITCGHDGDLCQKLSVVIENEAIPNDSHKVIIIK